MLILLAPLCFDPDSVRWGVPLGYKSIELDGLNLSRS
jgi:hypothetical protein